MDPDINTPAPVSNPSPIQEPNPVLSPAPKPSHKRRNLFISAALLVVIALGLSVWMLTKKDNKPTSSTTTQTERVTAQVDITPDGFVPAELKVAPGTKVVWVNTSPDPRQVAANPYPTREDLPELYSETPITTNESYSFVFEEEGSFGYHDPTNPTVGGIIQVTK